MWSHTELGAHTDEASTRSRGMMGVVLMWLDRMCTVTLMAASSILNRGHELHFRASFDAGAGDARARVQCFVYLRALTHVCA